MSRKFVPKSVLITQGELVNYAGSEIVTLELAEYFLAQGSRVYVYANHIDEPIRSDFAKLKDLSLHTSTEDINFEELDLVWIHHQLIPPELIPLKESGSLKAKVVFHHMSPYHPLEFAFSAGVESKLADLILFNSPETKRAIETPLRPFGLKGGVFGNPAPDNFRVKSSQKTYSSTLRNILVVSNHVPQEVLDALEILKKTMKLRVTILGAPKAPKRLSKKDLEKADLVITAAKTTQYALLSGVPVFSYDHFGGSGYLTNDNFDSNADLNFSGRGFEKKTAQEIADQLSTGYSEAQAFAKLALRSHAQEYTLTHRMDVVFKKLAETPQKTVEFSATDKAILNSLPVHFWSEHRLYRNIQKDLSARNIYLEGEVIRLKTELAQTYNSLSWKLTHGLRKVNKLARRLTKKVTQRQSATKSKQPKIIAVFSYRYDAQLVPDFLKNIDFVDDYIAYDDTKNTKLWFHNGKRHKELLKEARKRGADWILSIDPDERLEISAGKKIRDLVNSTSPGDKVIYGFTWRDLWTPKKYRTDGIWGTKKKFALFPLLPNQKFMNRQVHSQWPPINTDYRLEETGINLYHLKHIDYANTVARRDLYKSIDPTNRYQKIGYDYIADKTGMKLERIPVTRRFTPRYNPAYKIVQHSKQAKAVTTPQE